MVGSCSLFRRFAVTVTLMLAVDRPVLGEYLLGSHVKKLPSCSLADVSLEKTTDSEQRCKYACVHEGDCVAYKWDAATSNCQMQTTLGVTASSSAEDAVSVLLDEKDLPKTTCEGFKCPDGYRCKDSGPCAGLEVTCTEIPPADCAEILAADPASASGVYTIEAGGQLEKQVWCDMDTDGGGWTVFLKRQDGSVDFYLDYADYQAGFGDVTGEFWMGLDALRAMTSSKTYQVRADIEDWAGASVHSLHDSMLVADASDGYRLTVGAFVGGEGGDALSNGDSMQFTTRDRDQDIQSSVNCAQHHHGAFWYRVCQRCNPMGIYYDGGVYSGTNNGIMWKSWSVHNDNNYSMKTVALKLRP